jgi:hypothetical protein
VKSIVRAAAIAVLAFWLAVPVKAQPIYGYSQLRLVREIASATYLAEVCGDRIPEGLFRQR